MTHQTRPSLLALGVSLALLALLAPPTARADEPADLTPESAAQASSADGSEPEDGTPAETQPGETEAEAADAPSRGDNRVKDHAIGFGYYFTHMQWDSLESGSSPQVNYHAMAVRYAYYVGQAEGFGFMINAAATVPAYSQQSGVATNPALNRGYNLLQTYDRHVGFDLSFMAGTHRRLTDNLVAIGGLGLHVGIIKLNDDNLSIHEYIAVGASGSFSLRYSVTDIFTVGVDANASIDFRDMVKHRDALDYALNLGLTATIGLSF